MILAEEKGNGSRTHRDSIKNRSFRLTRTPTLEWNRKKKGKKTNSSGIHQIPSKKSRIFSPRHSRWTKSSGEIRTEREGRKSEPTYKGCSGEGSGHDSQKRRRPPTATAVLPAESRNSPGRSREHQPNPGRNGGDGGRRLANTQRPTGGGEGRLTAWGSRTEGELVVVWCGVGSRTVRRGAARLRLRRGWVEVEGRKHPDLPRLGGHALFNSRSSRRIHRRPPAVVGPAEQFPFCFALLCPLGLCTPAVGSPNGRRGLPCSKFSERKELLCPHAEYPVLLLGTLGTRASFKLV
jgi:hypothetical protein